VKNKAISKAIALSLCLTLPAFHSLAQIPVTDGVNLGTNINQHIESIAKFMEQVNALNTQIEQARDQYKSMTGSRGFGELFNDPELRNSLPPNWMDLYDAIQSGQIGGLSRRIDELMEIDRAGTIDEISEDIRIRQARMGATNRAIGEAGFETALRRTEQIQRLIEAISTTHDPKAIAELQARIAGEQALVANEIAKLQLVQMLQEAEQQRTNSRAREIYKTHMEGSNAQPRLPENFFPRTKIGKEY